MKESRSAETPASLPAHSKLETVNDLLRWGIGLSIRGLGLVLHFGQRLGLHFYRRRQTRLRRRYGLRPSVPVVRFGRRQVIRLRRASGGRFRLAKTSGSSGGGKEIPYNRWRVLQVKLTFVAMYARCCWVRGIRRPSLFVFASPDERGSLTSLLLEEAGGPSYLSGLQAPYRLLFERSVAELIQQYGLDAVRLWILTLSNPGVLYSTNPSTLWAFLEHVENDWPAVSRLVREYQQGQFARNCRFRRIGMRIASAGAANRLKAVATSPDSLPLSVYAPAVRTCICWTGGQVGPFLQRLERKLGDPRLRIVPMFSMSTETIETVSFFEPAATRFLPAARGVHYEFLGAGVADSPDRLLASWDLSVGAVYSMVVSDGWGLLRYQTEDLFRCRGFVGQAPDLEFVGRRGMAHSFTGEKVTGAQIEALFQRLRWEMGPRLDETLLTCFPFWDGGGTRPHYKIALLCERRIAAWGDRELIRLGKRADQLLCTINPEYRCKRVSGRLDPLQTIVLPFERLADLFSRSKTNSQFKFLTFYPRLVQDLQSSGTAKPATTRSR